MIASLTGVVKHIETTSVVIEVGGVGIVAHIPARLSGSMIVGKTASLQTSLVVREDSLTLYGFEDFNSRKIFEILQSATGIGPKVALSALNVYTAEELALAISREDNATLERVPGLGKKGVQRLILELKDKVEPILLSSDRSTMSRSKAPLWSAQIEEALTGLGFGAKQSQDAIAFLSEEFGGDVASTAIGELLKAALQNQGRNQ